MTLGRRVLRLASYRVRRQLDLALGSTSPPDPEPSGPPPAPRTFSPEPRPRVPPPAAPPPPVWNRTHPHPYQHEYRLLGAPVGSDLTTARRHWQQLVRHTHPDHFASDPAEERRATERLRRLNAAYERLRAYLESQVG